MGDWTVLGDADGLEDLIPGGPHTYLIENRSTGEVRKVSAWDMDQLGQKIANGEFDDEE